MGVWANLATIDSTANQTGYSFGSSTPPTSGDVLVIGVNAEGQQNLPIVTGGGGYNGRVWTSRVTQSAGGDRGRMLTSTSAGGAAGTVTLTWGVALTGCGASLDTHPDIDSQVPVQTANNSGSGTSAALTMSAFGDAANEGYYVAAITANAAVTIGGGYAGIGGGFTWQNTAFSGVVGVATNDPTPDATFASNGWLAVAAEFSVTTGIGSFAESPGTDDLQNTTTWTADGTQAQMHRSQEDGFTPDDPTTLIDTLGGADTTYTDTTAGHDKLWRYVITDSGASPLSSQLDIRQAPPRPTDLTLDSKTQTSATISLTRPSSSTRNQHNWYYRVKGDDDWIISHSEPSDGVEGATHTYDGPAFTPGAIYEFTATSTSTTYGVESGFATLLEVTLATFEVPTGYEWVTGYAPNAFARTATPVKRVGGAHI